VLKFAGDSPFVIPVPQLFIATRNSHKTAEIAAMLGPAWDVSDLRAHPEVPSPEETGATFMENAEIKAVAASRVVAGLVLADDSGLAVDALGGEPGVRSARYAGDLASDSDNRAKLLRALAGVSERRAWFHCAIALAEAGTVRGRFEGAVEGRIILEERGAGGFGYDALFAPDGFEQTFGELPSARKNTLSHRSRALAEAVKFLAAMR
jgi:XTP/dITP diphosphohydrolase